MSQMTPQEIVHELDKHIIGQDAAKRAVAIALRNRWRRQQVAEPLRQEITPKNILMIGPTGVGKTEIARRLARLADAPFIKVEATKFTEVGYVGRDVDTIIRDLVETAIKQTREQATRKVRHLAEDQAEEERDRGGETDTSRFLVAGARRALWVRVRWGMLETVIPRLRNAIDGEQNIIIESNSILRFFQPDVYLSVIEPATKDLKASAREFLDLADAFL